MNVKSVVDNKTFSKTVKSFFSDKSNNFENISPIENGKLFADDFETVENFSKYFQNLMTNLDLKVPNNIHCQIQENGDDVLAVISKYQNHPSIKTILKKYNFSFSSKTVPITDVEKKMKSLDTNKSHSFDIPTKFKNKTFFSIYIRLCK